MVNINPIEQQMDKVTFCSYNTAVSRFHYVNVVTQTNQVRDMSLDGVSIASEFKPVPNKKELSYARIPITHGSHTLESAGGGGFVAHIYGLGEYESYAYSIGSNSKVLNQFDEEGNLIISTIPDERVDSGTDPSSREESGGETTPFVFETDTLPTAMLGDVSISQLKQGTEIRGKVDDPSGYYVDPGLFDVYAESDYDVLFDSIDASLEGDTFALSFYPRFEWGDCFMPDRLSVNVVMVPKSEEGGFSKRLLIPVEIPVSKEGSWLSRCQWTLWAVAFLTLFILYLIALLRKKRFKKNAMVVPSYYDFLGNKVDQGGTMLRKKGFVSFVARWLFPRDERNTLDFSAPDARIDCVATGSADVIDIPADSVNPETMQIGNNHFRSVRDGRINRVHLNDNQRIRITTDDGTDLGYLTFIAGTKNDGGAYRVLITLLVVVSIISIITLVVLMIRGLL